MKRFGPVIVTTVHLGDFLHSGNKLNGNADEDTLMAVVRKGVKSYRCRVPDP